METKKDYKKIIELLVVFVVTVALILAVGGVLGIVGTGLPTNLVLFISESAIIVPAIIYCAIRKLRLREELGYRRIRGVTILLSVVLGLLVMPIASFVNVLSQFFVPNTMVQASDQLMGGSKLVLLLISGIYAPIVEEFVFRGVMNRGFSKCTTPVLGAIISAVLFGVMHLNLNQLCYAMALGLIFAWVNNNSRSVYPSTIMHFVLNSINVLMIIVASMAYEVTGGNLAESTEQLRNNTQSLALIAVVYFVMALIAFGLMIPCMKAIKKIEKADEEVIIKNDTEENEIGV